MKLASTGFRPAKRALDESRGSRCDDVTRGVSSAGRAPGLQPGGLRTSTRCRLTSMSCRLLRCVALRPRSAVASTRSIARSSAHVATEPRRGAISARRAACQPLNVARRPRVEVASARIGANPPRSDALPPRLVSSIHAASTAQHQGRRSVLHAGSEVTFNNSPSISVDQCRRSIRQTRPTKIAPRCLKHRHQLHLKHQHRIGWNIAARPARAVTKVRRHHEHPLTANAHAE